MNDYCDTFIEINSVATHVLQFGLKHPISEHNKVNDPIVVLMVSGNPGEIEYYKDFIDKINSELKLPVIGISHAGHSPLPKHMPPIPPINENPDLYSLNGQIFHKKCFIEKYFTKNSKLVLIGHSIGCYIILELLYRYPEIKAKVLHSIFVFPTIESLGDTSEGIKYKFMFSYFKYPLLWLAYAMDLLSYSSKYKIASYFLGIQFEKSPECAVKSVTNLFNPKCLYAMIYMAMSEFKVVKQLNRVSIGSNQKKLTFLYGEKDLWCPLEYYHRINGLYPECDIRLCLKDMNHAFILEKESTLRISEIVVQNIQSILKLL